MKITKQTHKGWIGVDLDGTLADYNGWVAADDIGEPIPAMVNRVKNWIAEGKDVRIFTARGSIDAADKALAYPAIERWCAEHIGVILPITNVKDVLMIALYDDRAFHVIKNTGQVLDSQFLFDVLSENERARQKFPSSYGAMCALTEEVGELAKAAMDEPAVDVYAEAVQVASMAMRVALEGDPSLDPIRVRRDSGPMVQPAP